MGDAPSSEHVPLFYIITYPRTCSNLLVRMLALDEQPSVFPAPDNGGYFFMPSFRMSMFEGLATKHVDQLSDEEASKMKQASQSCADTLGHHIAQAKSQHKRVVVKEHATLMNNPVQVTKFLHGPESTTQQLWTVDPGPAAFGEKLVDDQTSPHSPGNHTILPDLFLKAWKPTFLIRHPVATFPSFYRAMKDLMGGHGPGEEVQKTSLTFHWNRSLYDWYARQFANAAGAQNGDVQRDEDAAWPIILDADDIMTEPGMLVRYSEILGLDSTMLRFSWDKPTKEQLESRSPEEQRMLSTLLASSGIDKSKLSKELSIEAEAAKWREEFGEEQGAMVEQLVRDAMPDYEYMKSKRLRPAS
jgi:hypothetical protein